MVPASYRLSDGLGSTVALADAAGNVTATWTYDVFGAVRLHTGGSTEFTFTGEQNDPNGLEYLRARYYYPTIGRFLGRDPLGGGYPYAGNAYQHCLGAAMMTIAMGRKDAEKALARHEDDPENPPRSPGYGRVQ